MEESIFSKEPVYQLESRTAGITNIEISAQDQKVWGVGQYTFIVNGSIDLTIPIPVSKAVLDPRKAYAIRISVYEV